MQKSDLNDKLVMREGEIYHPLTGRDGVVAAALRLATAPFKGKMSGAGARGPYDVMMILVPAAPGVTYERTVVGGVPGVMCHPETARPDAALLYLHGGAYVLGSAPAYEHFCGHIAAKTQTATFIAGYRLAPEFRFPAAMDDAKAAYRGLIDNGARSVAIVGDSAGGGLALALLSFVQTAAREGSLISACAAAVMSPWTDLALTGSSMRDRAKSDPLVTQEMLATAGASYLDGHDARDPLTSPLYAPLNGLPPIAIHVGEDEVLLDDARRYVERARGEHVDAILHIWEGMMHVFPSNVGKLAAADKALMLIGDFLAGHLSKHSTQGAHS